jgi:hypothetical protein
MSPFHPRRTVAVAFALAVCLPVVARSQEAGHGKWGQVKCERYARAYQDSVARLGAAGLGAGFLSRHEAFLASGCTKQADVCPQSQEELRLANTLVIRGMNEGMASTFFPFACRKSGQAEIRSVDPRNSP